MHTAAGGASASASGSVGSAVTIDTKAHCGLMLTLQRSLNTGTRICIRVT